MYHSRAHAHACSAGKHVRAARRWINSHAGRSRTTMGGAPLVHDETRFTSGGGSSSFQASLPPPLRLCQSIQREFSREYFAIFFPFSPSSPPPPPLAIEDRLINIFSDKRQPVRLIYRGGNGWSWRIDRGVNQTECKNADGNAWAVEIA